MYREFISAWGSASPFLGAARGSLLNITANEPPRFAAASVTLRHIDASEPTVGVWIKETMHGYGFGREAVAAVVSFAARLGKQAVLYSVVGQNLQSRQLAECLGGHVIGKGTLRKTSGVEHPEVTYRILAADT